MKKLTLVAFVSVSMLAFVTACGGHVGGDGEGNGADSGSGSGSGTDEGSGSGATSVFGSGTTVIGTSGASGGGAVAGSGTSEGGGHGSGSESSGGYGGGSGTGDSSTWGSVSGGGSASGGAGCVGAPPYCVDGCGNYESSYCDDSGNWACPPTPPCVEPEDAGTTTPADASVSIPDAGLVVLPP